MAALTFYALTATMSFAATTRYVAKAGTDTGDCSNQTAPCLTIGYGLNQIAVGDTLIVGDGTYAEPLKMPSVSGSPSAYTTLQAEHDWGVTIDGSGFANNYNYGIIVGASSSYVVVRGFHFKMNQDNDTNQGIVIYGANHVKVQRCSVSYSGIYNNVAAVTVGPGADHTLIEECYAYGGSRYNFLVYQSTYTVMRRNVSRLDYWYGWKPPQTGGLQSANFTNYNGDYTVWENNIAIDSDTAQVSGAAGSSGIYGGFFNENKVPDSSWSGTATRETHRGNIVLNVQAVFSAIYDYDISNLHTYSDDIIWDSYGGYYGDYMHGDAPVLDATRFTIGKIHGTYDGHNGQGSAGTGFFIGPGTGGAIVSNTLSHSILWENPSYGVADYAVSDDNSFSSNGANYGGGYATPAAGAHDLDTDLTAGLMYLPRIEAGSALATAGSDGEQIGADVQYMWGTTGTLYGDPGYDTQTSTPLWPFPNEDVIGADMASYSGAGSAGARGFTAGNSRDGSAQTLTKYVWEYLGNQIPADIYGFHISTGFLPTGTIGTPYTATVTAAAGTPPYTWSFTGALPAGLSFDPSTATISGTPTTVETLTITANVIDSSSQTATKNYQIVIAEVGASSSSGSGSGSSSGGSGGSSASSSGGASSGSSGSSPSAPNNQAKISNVVHGTCSSGGPSDWICTAGALLLMLVKQKRWPRSAGRRALK